MENNDVQTNNQPETSRIGLVATGVCRYFDAYAGTRSESRRHDEKDDQAAGS